MKTNCFCDTPAQLVFAAAEGHPDNGLRPVTLAKNALWRSADRHSGVVIEVLDGRIWITVDGDPRDYVLRKGERFHSVRSKRVVAQGLGESARMFVTQ